MSTFISFCCSKRKNHIGWKRAWLCWFVLVPLPLGRTIVDQGSFSHIRRTCWLIMSNFLFPLGRSCSLPLVQRTIKKRSTTSGMHPVLCSCCWHSSQHSLMRSRVIPSRNVAETEGLKPTERLTHQYHYLTGKKPGAGSSHREVAL